MFLCRSLGGRRRFLTSEVPLQASADALNKQVMDLRRAYETICDENERLRVPNLTTDGQTGSFRTFPVHYQDSVDAFSAGAHQWTSPPPTASAGQNWLPPQVNPIPYILHPKPYTLRSTPCTPHSTTCLLHPTPYTLHPKPYTLPPAPAGPCARAAAAR